jgi:hypothetical protein
MAHNTSSQPPAAKGKPKRGVILLMVISLLALFVLIGVTYSILAMNYRQSTELPLRQEEYGDLPEKEFDLVLGQLLHDTFARSALRYHSLLGDLYGDTLYDDNSDSNPDDNTKVSLNAPPNGFIWGGQAYTFQVLPAALQTATPPGPLSPTLDYYSGRLLTFTEGPAKNYSGRIMQYDPTAVGGPQFVIEVDFTSHEVFGAPAVGNHFIINGAPFNGAGAGYDFTAAITNMEAVYGSTRSVSILAMPPTDTISPPVADLVSLLPHFNGFDPTLGQIYMNASGAPGTATQWSLDFFAAGGLDETWDAVDFQNMFLAMDPPLAATVPTIPIIPSYHRPELVNYWVDFILDEILGTNGAGYDRTDPNELAIMVRIMAQPYGPDGVRGTPAVPGDDPVSNMPTVTHDMLDRIYNLTHGSIFRPMPWDHPNFTGSNAAFTGTFDTATGNITNADTLFTNLINSGNVRFWDVDNDNDGVADSIWIDPGLPVVTSKDGRRYKRLFAIKVLDLDGRIDMNAHGNLSQLLPANRADEPLAAAVGLAPAGESIPRGMGFGPAEVNFINMFTTGGVPDTATYELILRGRYASNLTNSTPPPVVDSGTTAAPGLPNARDGFNIVKHHGVPNQYPTIGGWYASPPDVWGRAAITLDYGGQPISVNSAAPGEMLDNPYEISLYAEPNNGDSPYTLFELERLLRNDDVDVQMLVCRPMQLAGGYLGGTPGASVATRAARQRLTGRGSHLPVPGTVAPGDHGVTQLERSTNVPGQATILDLYKERLIAGYNLTKPITPAEELLIAHQMNRIVPWELRQGRKFDINRWLGDGFDSSVPVNGTGDDPVEAFADPANPMPFNTPPFNGPRETAWLGGPTGYTGINAEHVNGMDANLDGVSADSALSMTVTPATKGLDRMMARQLFARQLFCLTMLFFDRTGFMPAPPQVFPHEPGLNVAQRRELYTRRIAQWVINVVDFRDSDAIMTPFEYDINPWNGWQVDGNLATDGNTVPEQIADTTNVVQPVTTADRRLVWGAEHPDLLITESLFFHDRRVRDTGYDDDTGKLRDDDPDPDNDLDQYRRPEGSGFIELYCARAFNWSGVGFENQKPRMPAELYDLSVPGNPRLDLGRLAPGGWPVWRMAFSELSYSGGARPNGDFPETIKPNVMATPGPTSALESGSFEAAAPGEGVPRDVNLLVPYVATSMTQPTGNVPLSRYLWFNTQANLAATVGASPFAAASFYSNGNANPRVAPGQYAIVGPRVTTYLGSHNPMTVMPPPMTMLLEPQTWGGYSPQTISMDFANGELDILDTMGALTSRTAGTTIRGAVPIVADWQGAPIAAIGLNAGMPWMNPTSIGLNLTEPLYGTYYPEPEPVTPPPLPMGGPTDFYDNPDGPINTFPDEPFDQRETMADIFPLGENDMAQTGTYTDVATAYLQRLANPLLPYDVISNPYITVDWAALDVTVFTGEEDTNRQVMVGMAMEDVDPSDSIAGREDMKWSTRQRGLTQPPGPIYDANPWPAVTLESNDNGAPTGPGSLYFRPSLDSAQHTLPFLNDTLGSPLNAMSGYLGELNHNAQAPPNNHTFPWLVHLDRPLMSPFELLQVSSSSPARRFTEVTPGFFFGVAPNSVYNNNSLANLRAPFGHLMNFFHSDTNTANSPQFQRLLDYLEVPSPYSGTERWFNPANFVASGLYRPPFNKLSRFRDPGRININTIFDADVWSSSISQFPAMNTPPPAGFVGLLNDSRRGFPGPTLDQLDGSGNPVPTLFGNPFRPADAYDLMPDPFGPVNMRQPSPVNATFLRPERDTPTDPLFDHQAIQPADVYRNTNRNAYFRYQALQKLGNTFTTHSNVFAVWMTVGYFEVEDNVNGAGVLVVDAAHPDGLRLGAEIGADSGEIVRHRFFAIIDRSVPVGFAHGQKLNTDNCVLLRRVIE